MRMPVVPRRIPTDAVAQSSMVDAFVAATGWWGHRVAWRTVRISVWVPVTSIRVGWWWWRVVRAVIPATGHTGGAASTIVAGVAAWKGLVAVGLWRRCLVSTGVGGRWRVRERLDVMRVEGEVVKVVDLLQ